MYFMCEWLMHRIAISALYEHEAAKAAEMRANKR